MGPKEFKGLMNYLTRPSDDKKRQKGYFETNDPKEAVREVIRRVVPIDQYTFPITSSINLGLGPNLNQTNIGGEFDVGGGTLSVGGGMKGDDKAFGIGFRKEFKRGTPITKNITDLVKKYRIEDKMGSGMIADAIQKNNKLNVGRSTVTKILKNLKDQGVKGIDIPTSELASSVAQRLDPNISTARSGERKIYKVVRPVRDVDFKINPDLPKGSKFKVQLPSGSADGPSTVTKYFKTKDAAEAGIKKAEANILQAKKLKAKPFDNAVKAIHNIALEGVDEINDVKNLSKLVYGDSSLKNIKNISNDLVKYQEFLLGFREVPGLKTPNVNQLDEIFAEFPSQNQWGQFAGEELRRSKLKIRDNILKTKGEKLFTTRQKILKAIDTGVFNLDEAMGLSATFENAPGYTELGQIIKKKVNSIKGRQIDGPFSRIFPKVLDGTASVEEVNNFNKISSTFQNKHGVDTPLIEYEPGKKLQAKKFISNFSDLSEGAQTNIQSLADKGVVLKTKSSPMSTILKGVAKKSAKYIPFIGTGIGIADVAKAKELGVDNPIDLFAAYHISPEVALASKKYREDPEYRAKSLAETMSIPLDEGTFEAIDEQPMNIDLTMPKFSKGGRIGFESGTIPGGYTDDAYKYLREMDDEIFNSYKKYRAGGGKMKYGPFAYNAKRMMFGAFGVGQKKFAEGGGVKSGPPPESGPTPHGLPSLMKRGMKI